MKLQLDFEKKTIKLLEDVKLSEFVTKIEEYIPDWPKWSIVHEPVLAISNTPVQLPPRWWGNDIHYYGNPSINMDPSYTGVNPVIGYPTELSSIGDTLVSKGDGTKDWSDAIKAVGSGSTTKVSKTSDKLKDLWNKMEREDKDYLKTTTKGFEPYSSSFHATYTDVKTIDDLKTMLNAGTLESSPESMFNSVVNVELKEPKEPTV